MEDSVKKRVIYCLLAAAAICCPAIIKAVNFAGISAVAAFIWLYVCLELVCRFRTGKALLLTGIVFVSGYSLVFWNALGTVWVSIVLFGFFGAVVYASICFSAYVMLRFNRFPATLVFPGVWLIEYGLATAIRFPTLVRMDPLFADMTVLMQAERLIGAAGLSFVILWLVAMLRYAVANRKMWCCGLSAGLFLILFLPGIFFLYPNTAAEASVRVAYTTGPYVGDSVNYSTVPYEVNEESIKSSVSSAALQKAEILVLSEEAFEMDDYEEPRFLETCSLLAKENSIAVLIGLEITDTDNSEGGKSLNKLVFIDSDGEILGSYQKSNLIPIIESDFVPGDRSIPSHCLDINGKTVKLSYLICYDSNFPAYVSRIDADTDILLLPSWDWSEVTELHSKLCRAIAVENHVCILKPTYDGLSIAIDPDGQVFHTGSTDVTGFEQVQIVEMPIKSSSKVIERTEDTSPFTSAIIGTEMLSVLLCLLLLVANRFESRAKTGRSVWFGVLTAVAMAGCFSDALSWLLDGCTKLSSVLYFTTTVSMVITVVLVGIFTAYLSAYVKERQDISNTAVCISWTYVGLAAIATLVTSITGDLFVFQNGFYSDGRLYTLYVIVNAGSMVLGMVIVSIYRRALDLLDRAAVYGYMIIPIISAVINIFVEEWSFVYPAIALSLMLIYAMLQSERMERLEHEGKIVSYYATHDELTGLHNRRAFHDRTSVMKTKDESCGVIFGDVNGLKHTNDTCGHDAGDQLLIRFADILSANFRMNEVFRTSGDEFLCIMESISENTFTERTNALRAVLEQDELPLASIGTAFGRTHDIETLIKTAEARMYIEKESVHKSFPTIRRQLPLGL